MQFFYIRLLTSLKINFHERYMNWSIILQVKVEPNLDASAVQMWGPGVEPSKIREDNVMKMFVDASQAAPEDLNVDISTNRGKFNVGLMFSFTLIWL